MKDMQMMGLTAALSGPLPVPNHMNSPELSQDDVRELLRVALREKYPKEEDGCYIRDVFASTFVYEHGPKDKLYRQPFAIADGQVSLAGEPVEVVRVTEYRPAKEVAVHKALGKRMKTMKAKEAY